MCRPNVSEIDATTPVGLVGDVEIRVEASDNPGNGDVVVLRFMERQVPRPYHQYIDRQRLRSRIAISFRVVVRHTESKH